MDNDLCQHADDKNVHAHGTDPIGMFRCNLCDKPRHNYGRNVTASLNFYLGWKGHSDDKLTI